MGDELSSREMQILHGIADGKSQARMAAEMFLSHTTIKTYVHRVFDKLGARNGANAVKRAYERGLLTIGNGSEAR